MGMLLCRRRLEMERAAKTKVAPSTIEKAEEKKVVEKTTEKKPRRTK